MSLSLEWLGAPTVRVGGRELRLGVKALSLLALMSVEGRVRRRQAGRWLWPGANDSLNSVSAARVSLVKSLGAAWLGGDAEYLWLERDWTCDVNSFRAALEANDAAALEGAWASWRGAFLDGLRLPDWQHGLGEEFENWVYSQRERLETERADLGFKLARLAAERGDLASAATYLELTGGDHGEPREDAERLLLLLHGALGRPDEATQGFARLERRLRSELGVEPTAQTRAALEAARGGSEASQAALLALLRPASVAATTASRDAPFVGRRAELAALLEVFARRDAVSQVALIAGEPGAGKTRLMREALHRIAASDARTRVVSIGLSSSSLPFSGAIGLIGALLAQQPQRLERLPPVWRELLLRLEAEDLEITASKRALFAAALELLDGESGPVVLALDDLQWVDAPSLELLLHLLQAPRLLILATLRDTETPRAELRGLFEVIARAGRGVRLSLKGLSSADLAALAERLGREDVDAHRLHRSSGGNPFYALELLRAPESGGRAHDLARLRLESLDGAARQTLEALAVLGDGATQGAIRGVSGRSLEENAGALAELVRVGLLGLDAGGARFAHDLTREVTLNELGPVRRELLHLRAARGAAPSAASAEHYWTARAAWEPLDEAPRALAALLEAGRVYARRGDLASAQTWFERGLEIAPSIAARIRVLTERARQLERFGQHGAALEALDGADALLGFAGDALLLSDALITRAHLLALKLGQPDAAEPLVERALRLLAHGLPGSASGFEPAALEPALAEPLTAAAASLAPLSLAELRGDALGVAGTISRLRGDPLRAATYFRQALTLRRALRDPWRLSSALNNLATALIQTRDPSAETHLREAIQLSEASGDVVGLARALNNLGVYYNDSATWGAGAAPQDLSRHAEAKAVYERVLELQRGIGDEWGIASASLNLGVTAFYQGHFDEARHWYAQTLALARAHDLAERRLEALYNLAEVELERGDAGAAAMYLRELSLDAQMRDDPGVRALQRTLETRNGETRSGETRNSAGPGR